MLSTITGYVRSLKFMPIEILLNYTCGQPIHNYIAETVREKCQGVKKSHSSLGILNRHQECKGMQRHDQHFLHMGLLSHDNKPHSICT